MKLDTRLAQLLNDQVANELSSSYIYLAMAAWFERTPYTGFATWMFTQSREENAHAMKFMRYLIDRGAEVVLRPIPQPPQSFQSPLEVFEQSLVQEERVTRQINELYEVAEQVKDHASKNLLLWFLNEQMEEEKTVGEMLERLKLAGSDPASLLGLDREAAARKDVPVGEE